MRRWPWWRIPVQSAVTRDESGTNRCRFTIEPDRLGTGALQMDINGRAATVWIVPHRWAWLERLYVRITR